MDRDFLHNQLIKLGDMMGDGLHYEPDGKWIEKEYRKVFNLLYPEHKKELRSKKSDRTNEQMKKLLEMKTCSCGGKLKQARSGSSVAYCEVCNNRYKATKKKSK
jgi:hypothetical protein